MNFQNLEYFIAVAEEGNITKAAAKLHLSQQALSGHLSRLEEELGIELFSRKPGLKLTYAGHCFREKAEALLSLERDSVSMMKDLRENVRGELRIGISYSRGRAVLPMVLPEYTTTHPLVECSIYEDNAPVLENKLNQGELDLIINFLPFVSPLIESEPLFTERLFLVVPKVLLKNAFGNDAESVIEKFRVTNDLSLFADFPFVLLRKGEHIRRSVDREFSLQQIKPEVKIETANTQTAIALAAEGMGITIVHETFLSTLPTVGNLSPAAREDRLVLIPMTRGGIMDVIGIGYPKNRYLPRIAKDFIDLCHSKLSEETFRI